MTHEHPETETPDVLFQKRYHWSDQIVSRPVDRLTTSRVYFADGKRPRFAPRCEWFDSMLACLEEDERRAGAYVDLKERDLASARSRQSLAIERVKAEKTRLAAEAAPEVKP